MPFIGMGTQGLTMALQEIKLLAELDHPHILKYIHGLKDGFNLCLVTEFCCNGDIDAYLQKNKGKKLEERVLLTWVKQIVNALAVTTHFIVHLFNPSHVDTLAELHTLYRAFI